LTNRIHLRPEELDAWRRAAEHMYLPEDAAPLIHPQDDSVLY
jgi:trehalose/maltose hydrolase-like predicted phosphorylase